MQGSPGQWGYGSTLVSQAACHLTASRWGLCGLLSNSLEPSPGPCWLVCSSRVAQRPRSPDQSHQEVLLHTEHQPEGHT